MNKKWILNYSTFQYLVFRVNKGLMLAKEKSGRKGSWKGLREKLRWKWNYFWLRKNYENFTRMKMIFFAFYKMISYFSFPWPSAALFHPIGPLISSFSMGSYSYFSVKFTCDCPTVRRRMGNSIKIWRKRRSRWGKKPQDEGNNRNTKEEIKKSNIRMLMNCKLNSIEIKWLNIPYTDVLNMMLSKCGWFLSRCGEKERDF